MYSTCGSVLEVESVVRRIEKRIRKVILLPEWSSGGVKPRSVSIAKIVLGRSNCVLAKFFISVAVIVLGRRFSVVRTGCILSLEKICYLLLQSICSPQNSTSVFISVKDQIGSGNVVLIWLCLILCSLHSLLSCLVLISVVLANVAATCLVQTSTVTEESNKPGGAWNVLLVLF